MHYETSRLCLWLAVETVEFFRLTCLATVIYNIADNKARLCAMMIIKAAFALKRNNHCNQIIPNLVLLATMLCKIRS